MTGVSDLFYSCAPGATPLRILAVFCALGLGFLALGGCERLLVDDPRDLEPDPAVLAAQEPIEEPVVIEIPDPHQQPAFVLDKRTQVSVLGYHDFTTGHSSNPMKINIDKFRGQMQSLVDNGIEVISMTDFLAWKRGEKNLPDPCALITVDDGWREVYTLAFPVMKEFGFPFTLFLYTNYLDIGGRSLTSDRVREMLEWGAEVGSHSISHLDMTRRHGLSDEGYEEFLMREMKESLETLRGKFDRVSNTFSYPYGKYSQRMIEIGEELGYEAMVTVDGRKTSWS
ncbi:MAG: polysaccharide deacetylase family protein, partial [Verrucomicrobiales bacterium]